MSERDDPRVVEEIPDPDEWRIRDHRDEDTAYHGIESEIRYLVNYQYIRAVHLQRQAAAMEDMARWLETIAYYLDQHHQQ